MRRALVGLERSGIVIDFVQEHPVRGPGGDHDVELAAAEFIANRRACVFDDEFPEALRLPRFQLKLDHDHVSPHGFLP